MSDDLIAFVQARLDEDEQTARAVLWEGSGNKLSWSLPASATVDVGEDDFYAGDRTVADHIVRHDPARVLAEVDAKRRRLNRHTPERRRLSLADETGTTSFAFYVCTWCTPSRTIEIGQDVIEWPCPDVRDDAAPYADHPDYRSEWRP